MVNYVGDANANFFVGTSFKDTLDGQGGADSLFGQGSHDSILGGDGADSLSGGVGKDTLRGGLDTDIIDASIDSDADQVFGDDGNDFISGRAKDTLDGGIGSDFVGLNLSLLSGLNLDLSTLTSGGTISFFKTTITNFETGFIQVTNGDDKVKAPLMTLAINGLHGNDTLLGGLQNDVLVGGSDLAGDNDVLKGSDGADSLTGGFGDLLDGGPGFTDFFTLQLINTTTAFTVNFSALYSGGTVFVGGGGTRVVRCEVGTAQFGSGDDNIKTGSLAFSSGVIVDGGLGNDTLIGGDGNDNMYGGQGNDVIRGGLGIDTANYQTLSAAITVDLNIVGFQDTGGAGMDSLASIERVNGGQSGDRIVGNAENNTFEGYGGADTLIGGQGDDTLNGGSGGFDPLTDTDRLSGGAGQDTYRGGNGDDVLVWSSSFHTAVAAPDQIVGLEAGDVIHIKDIDADTTVGGDQAFTVVSALTGVAGQLALVLVSGMTHFLMDVDGDAVADGQINALGDHTGHTEFVL